MQSSEEECLHHKIPVTDGIHGVGADPTVEAQLLSNELAVHPKRVSCQSPCSQYYVNVSVNVDMNAKAAGGVDMTVYADLDADMDVDVKVAMNFSIFSW